MLRSCATLIGECGIGRNRCDPQQREQAVKALVDIAVDAVKDRLECAHEQLRRGQARLKKRRSTCGLYILILAGLFGNRWNAKEPPATSYPKFCDHTKG